MTSTRVIVTAGMTISHSRGTQLRRARDRIAELERQGISMELRALLRKQAEQTADLQELERTLEAAEEAVGGEHLMTQYHPAFREYSSVRRRFDALQALIVQTAIEISAEAHRSGVIQDEA